MQDNIKLSNLERKVLDELQKNCRINIDEIGKKCDCSRYKVSRIIKKLEKSKAIIGYTTAINPNIINLKYFILLIKRSSEPLNQNISKHVAMGDFTDLLPEIDVKIIDTLYLNGYYDFMITFTTDDITKAKETYNRLIEIYSKYIDRMELLETVIPFRLNGIRIIQPDLAKVL